jgi:Fe2+ or Zn2+ uptake regulation protein
LREIQEFVSPTFERLKRQIGATNNVEIQVIRLEVGGRCSACAGQKKKMSHLQ